MSGFAPVAVDRQGALWKGLTVARNAGSKRGSRSRATGPETAFCTACDDGARDAGAASGRQDGGR